MNPIKEANYWDEDGLLPAFTDPPPRRTEILVVGSGYTGTTAAIRLRQAGREVTVIDAKPLGSGASARNGGMVLNGLSADLTAVVRRYGLAAARRLFRESVAAVDAVERLVHEGAIDCAFTRCGFLYAAFKPRHAAALRRSQDFMAERLGHTAEWIPPERLREEIDSPLYHGALLENENAGLHPARYIAGLLRMARRLGVSLHEGVTALRMTRRAGGLTVHTDRGAIRADTVVAATNGYTGALTPWLRRRIMPVRSLMIATAPLPRSQVRALIPKGRMVADTKTFLYYFRPSPDGTRLLFGGRPPFPKRSPAENARHMRASLATVFPQLSSTAVDCVWWGRLGFTRDHLPHAGQREGLTYAAGYGGHGVALATHLGEKLAGRILDNGTGETAFADLAFRSIPLYDGRPWFLPLVYRWFGLKDRLL